MIWRYKSDGTLDTSFGNGTGYVVHSNAAGGGGNDAGYAITLDSSGRIIVVGMSDRDPSASANHDMVIWRYNPDGTLDTSFNGVGYVVHNGAAGGNGIDAGGGVVLDSAGRILVAGSSTNSGGNRDMAIWRYNPDGTLDTSFNNVGYVVHDNAAGGNGHDSGNDILLDSLGRIVVVGSSTGSGTGDDMAIWRYK